MAPRTTHRRSHRALVAALGATCAALLAAACAPTERSMPPPTSVAVRPPASVASAQASIGGGPPDARVPRADAAETLATARCEGLERCGAVGAGRFHATRAQCLVAELHAANVEWSESVCARLDLDKLDRCLDAVRAAGCPGGQSAWPTPVPRACSAEAFRPPVATKGLDGATP